MPIAPDPRYPENTPNVWVTTVGPNRPGQQGPLRFEEGIATDTPVTDDFMEGLSDGYMTPPDSPNHNNPAAQYKHADQVMRERAHVGSASWVEAGSQLRSFVEGVTEPPIEFPLVRRSGGRYERLNATVVGESSEQDVYDRFDQNPW